MVSDATLVSIRMEGDPLLDSSRATRWGAKLTLVGIGLIYGSLDVCYKVLFSLPSPPTVASASLVKTLLGTVALLPSMVQGWHETSRERLWPTALSLASWNVSSCVCLYASIARTEASRAAFLLQLSVVATPIIEFLLLRRSQPAVVWAGAVVALVGVALLSSPSETAHHGGAVPTPPTTPPGTALLGDMLAVLSAMLWGFYLVRTAAVPVETSAARLQSLKYIFALAMYAAWSVLSPVFLPGAHPVFAGFDSPLAWLLICYAAFIAGVFADIVQQKAQVLVRASEASLLLASEPLWALVIAVPLLGEHMGIAALIGGFLIFLAAAVSTGLLFSPPPPSAAASRVPIDHSKFDDTPPLLPLCANTVHH